MKKVACRSPVITEAEFETFVHENNNRLVGRAFGFVRDEAAAKDCVQITLVRAWQSRKSFKGNSSFSTWVNQILTHTCIDYLRFAKRERSWREPINGWEADSDEWKPREFIAESDHEPDKLARVSDLERRLLEAVAELSSSQAEVFRRLIKGEGPLEISASLRIPISSVRTRLFYGRRRLRRILASHQFSEDLTLKGL